MRRSSRLLAVAATLLVALALPSALGAASGTPRASATDDLKINQFQVIGSHNSYHEIATEAERKLRRSFIGDAEDELDYTHRPLDGQFAHEKVRQIELDVMLDAKGGRYANPLIRSFVQGGPYDPAMKQPGLKVLHIQDVDYHSTCLSFIACLTTMKQWSDANPTHMPITVLIELKDDNVDTGGLDFVDPEPFTAANIGTVDKEIREVLPADRLITPDDVRGSHATLEEAVLADSWPTLGESRGKFMFLMDNGGAYRDKYRQGHPNLEGRVLFTNSNPGQPDAAFVERNGAADSFAEIGDLVKAGYVVRTRADSPGNEAPANDHATADKALASGAQWVSTDYPIPAYAQELLGNSYSVSIPGGTVARCNPVTQPVGCTDAEIDSIYSAYPPEPPTTTTTTTTTAPTTTTTTPAGEAPAATPVQGDANFTG